KADLEITRLTQELEEHRIQIKNLETCVSQLECDTYMIKINLQQHHLLDAQLEDLIN
ncbi:4631_t:CDS:1, partial [Cetraspora pellucida]